MTVGDTLLDTLRGGFDLGGGLKVSFGISKATTAFHISDVGRITPAQADAFNRQMAVAGRLQIGTRRRPAADQ